MALDTAPTPEENLVARTYTFLTNYLPGPVPVVDTTPTGHWTPSLPKAKATVKAAPAKAATRPAWTPAQWQDWQDSGWWQDADDYDRYPNWRSSQRHGPYVFFFAIFIKCNCDCVTGTVYRSQVKEILQKRY